LQASDIEALYIIFDDAVLERLISCRVERRAVTSVKGVQRQISITDESKGGSGHPYSSR
jgi:hypothetical protein